jgi:N-acyl-L-homoserine lactone synthetase
MNANIIISLMLAWYQTAGRDGLKRAITVPQKDIEKICKRTGANL